MSVDVKVKSNLPTAKQALKMALKQWANRTGGKLVNLTNRDAPSATNPNLNGRGTPVDTGYLRNSMAYAVGGGTAHTSQGGSSYKADKGGKTGKYSGSAEKDNAGYTKVYIGTNVEYAEPVEEGARGRSGAHMLRNAVMDCKHDAKKYLKEALKDQNVY